MLGCCNRFNKPLPQAENLLSVWFMYHLYQYYVVNSFLVFLISDQELTSQKNCRQAIREGSHNGSHNGSRVVVFWVLQIGQPGPIICTLSSLAHSQACGSRSFAAIAFLSRFNRHDMPADSENISSCSWLGRSESQMFSLSSSESQAASLKVLALTADWVIESL